MSRERFQAREKKVQKMGRDGLVEHNRATGEEKRVSQRTADAAFDRARPTEREDIRRPAVRGADTGKKRKQPRPAPETRAEQTEVLLTPEYLADATAEPPPDAPATMRGAVDMPLLDAPAAEEPTPAPVRKHPQKRGKTSKKKQSTKFTEHAARPDSEEKTAMRGVEGAPAPKRRTTEGGSRLRFDKEEPADPATDRTAIRKRQAAKSAQHAARPDSRETSAMRGSDNIPATKRRISEGGSRLQFSKEEEPADTTADRTAIKKRQAAKLSDHAAKPEDKQKSEDRLKSDGNPKAGGTRLKFEDTPKDSETAGDTAPDAPTRQQKK